MYNKTPLNWLYYSPAFVYTMNSSCSLSEPQIKSEQMFFEDKVGPDVITSGRNIRLQDEKTAQGCVIDPLNRRAETLMSLSASPEKRNLGSKPRRNFSQNEVGPRS